MLRLSVPTRMAAALAIGAAILTFGAPTVVAADDDDYESVVLRIYQDPERPTDLARKSPDGDERAPVELPKPMPIAVPTPQSAATATATLPGSSARATGSALPSGRSAVTMADPIKDKRRIQQTIRRLG